MLSKSKLQSNQNDSFAHEVKVSQKSYEVHKVVVTERND